MGRRRGGHGVAEVPDVAPGLSFVALSERAWAASAAARLPRNYWDFAEIRRAVTKARPETPGTPPVHIVLQVAEALRMIHEEGLDARVPAARRRWPTRSRAAWPRSAWRCSARHSAAAPRRSRRSRCRRHLPPQRVRDGIKARGILTAAALGRYEPTAFRIGHMGDIRLADVERTLAALADVLAPTR